ncbi:MAG: DUF350 domain-containing protein [Candidatus Aminicenantes bacterium]|nr:DUF350 domain-containing protein [Candidatus Aminicenantes bacterium]NIM81411.1 DUF350 domain-containing protein [Candidatus Aminicenantes bacterium]NIN23043.1 DUF350 domain-containing protein [Candidatus Aminicenantes bacterium]NIN44597.1 DUF350 domain-containing protein [Candidatus Aminicenantes bacterium]NIN89692.1 DUF350 domain-containing protein [Candidatus Aminicenantes bacterium]
MHDLETPGLELFSTIIYIFLIFASVIISLVGSIVFITFLTRRKIDVKEEIVYNRNIGIALVLGSFIWTLAQMCLESVKPIMNSWYSRFASGFTFKSALSFAFGIVGALVNALLIGAITVYLSVKVLMIINKDIDEWEEIKEGNIAVAIVIAVTVIVVGIFFKSIIGYIVWTIFSF